MENGAVLEVIRVRAPSCRQPHMAPVFSAVQYSVSPLKTFAGAFNPRSPKVGNIPLSLQGTEGEPLLLPKACVERKGISMKTAATVDVCKRMNVATCVLQPRGKREPLSELPRVF